MGKSAIAAILFAMLAAPTDLPAQQEDLRVVPEVADDPAKPPPLPEKIVNSDDQAEPTVNITEDEDKVVEEHVYNGRVYLVKVTPKHGKPYYYMDVDGDGQLELQKYDNTFSPAVPVLWKIKEW